ncbi:hypothetical protein KKC97_08830 [bacterium]|nr:hypothetical protein [bacterium]
MFQTFSDVEAYLNSLVNYEHAFPLGGIRDRPKLQPVLNAIERLGFNRALPNCVHIAGTVGKGSVAGYLEAVLSTAYQTLSFTSPHLISVKERVKLNGRELDDEIWCDGFSSIVSRLRTDPVIALSYFESVFIFYIWVSRELKCECHVVETGLGGRFDATNVLENSCAVLTRIDYDHTAILGKTLTEITKDKCGIIKPGSTVISAEQQEESIAVIERIAKEQNAHLIILNREFFSETRLSDEFEYRDVNHTIKRLSIKPHSDFQRENAAIALAAAYAVDPDLPRDSIRKALTEYTPPARQQLLPGMPPILLDTAHNPASFKVLAETLRERYNNRRIKAVIGMMKDKDARTSLEHLRGLVEGILVVSTGNPRSYAPKELVEIAKEAGIAARAYRENQYAYLDLHENKLITLGLVTGSFYVAGDYLKWRTDAGIA